MVSFHNIKSKPLPTSFPNPSNFWGTKLTPPIPGIWKEALRSRRIRYESWNSLPRIGTKFQKLQNLSMFLHNWSYKVPGYLLFMCLNIYSERWEAKLLMIWLVVFKEVKFSHLLFINFLCRNATQNSFTIFEAIFKKVSHLAKFTSQQKIIQCKNLFFFAYKI